MIVIRNEGPCLNPCCNGIYLIIYKRIITKMALCLNPCCNGIYLIIKPNNYLLEKPLSLNPCCNGIYLIIII